MVSPKQTLFVCAGDNGSLHFWDWKTGYNFQKHQTTVQPGSLDSEAGIFKCLFDVSGCRLLTAEADKTIKIYKEDESAVSNVCCVFYHFSFFHAYSNGVSIYVYLFVMPFILSVLLKCCESVCEVWVFCFRAKSPTQSFGNPKS